MQITIYIQNKPVILCDTLTPELELIHHQPSSIFIDELNTHTIKSMLTEIALPEIERGIFLHPNFEELKTQFFKKFERHVAGGGLVLNGKNEMLMIFRRGFWDLPKGHLDPGETIEECSIREVQEETGLRAITITSPLTITYHTYEQGTHHILKEAHWYLMKSEAEEPLVPQTEEDIEQIEWVKTENLPQYLANAYPSIRKVMKAYLA